MSKDTQNSRLPRLSGATRIPLPGSLRVPAQGVQKTNNRLTQILRPTSVMLNQKRTLAANSGIKPPTTATIGTTADGVKKSSSGDKLNSVVSLVSRKTNTALKNILGRATSKQMPASKVNTASNKPQLTTRSSTFVRDDNPNVTMDMTHNILVQSTPAAAVDNWLHGEIRQHLNETYDTTAKQACMLLQRTSTMKEAINPFCLDVTFNDRAADMETQLGKTHTVNTPDVNATQNLSSANLIGQTMCVASPINDVQDLKFMQKSEEAQTQEQELESLQMLDDVSLPSCFDMDITLKSQPNETTQNLDLLNVTTLRAPDRSSMKLPLNSTVNAERLLSLTPQHEMHLLDFSRDFLPTPLHRLSQRKNNTQLLYKTPSSASTTPDCTTRFGNASKTPISLTPFALKCVQSDLLLPTHTPDEELQLRSNLLNMAERTDEFQMAATTSLQDVSNTNAKKSRFSFGLDLTESTLDCSIELVDVSLSFTQLANSQTQSMQQQQQQQQLSLLKKQNSIDLDESLGILTPDQMKEFLDSNTQNTNNMELQCLITSNKELNKLALQQIRIDQTPSPEDLPLDTVAVRTDISEIVLAKQQQQPQQSLTKQKLEPQQQQQQQLSSSNCNSHAEAHSQHTDTEQMSKSAVSKISTSFITSVTSVTSLDTGYQGDGEMSRPASRGASDHSPSNGPALRKGAHVSRQPSFNQLQQQQQQQMQLPAVRRQDPMTDSDFFTESDADDIFHRGDRRAQVIDGQLYGPMLQQPAASVYISEDPQMEDSCMESSGIFTDIENRCDEDLAQMRRQDTQDLPDMSPDLEMAEGDDSTETVKSNNRGKNNGSASLALGQGQAYCSSSQTSSTIQSSFSNDRLSAATTLSNRTSYCSVDGSCVNVDCKQSCSSLEEAFKSYQTNARQQLVVASSLSSVANEQSSCKYDSSLSSSLSLNNAIDVSACVNRLKTELLAPVLKSGATLKNIEKSAITNECAKKSQLNLKSAQPEQQQQQQQQQTQKIVRKLHSTNKWEAVMNKIANNKPLVKKNYNDVKSKVSTRLSALHLNGSNSPTDSSSAAASSPTMRRSPTNAGQGSAGHASSSVTAARKTQTTLSATRTERLLQGVAKRGRSYSKDSQKSSLSDLSLTSGSPKTLAKTPLRAAKKRDVRNLSISPTDLGPPPKTQQTTNGTSTNRAKSTAATAAIPQKRFSSSLISNGGSPTPSNASPTAYTTTPQSKKSVLTTKRLDVKSNVRNTLKDHNCLNSVVAATTTTATTVKSASGDSSKAETPTEPHEFQRISNAPSQLLSSTGIRKSFNSNAVHLDKKSQPKQTFMRKVEKPLGGKFSLRPVEQHEIDEDEYAVTTTSNASTVSLHNVADLEPPSKDVEALAVLLQYAVFDLDAFACPQIKKDNEKVKAHLEQTLQSLDEAKADYLKLQDQLNDKEAFYMQREDELQSLHRCELEKAQINLKNLDQLANQQIAVLESKLAARETENKSLKTYHIELDQQLNRKQKQLELAAEREQDLKERVSEAEALADTLRRQLKFKESAHAAELHAAAEREEALKIRLDVLSQEIKALQDAKEQRERLLCDKLQLTQDEIPLLRTPQRSFNGNSGVNPTATPRHSSGTPTIASSTDLNLLQREIDSLRFVVDLRQDDNARLVKQNEELMRDAQECAMLRAKLSSLESRNELLKSEVDIKSEREKELLSKIEDLEKTVKHENHQRTRLSYDKEALQYQLKQRSDQLHIVENQLKELSSAQESLRNMSSLSSFYTTPQMHDASDGSPPPSPIVKGVIEKTESISYVLEMENETAEAAASKLVRRANSVRCGIERSPSLRRQFSANNGQTITTPQQQTATGVALQPNPLSLSLSATTVMRNTHSSRHHSNSNDTELANTSETLGNRSYPRMRSKSVSVKCSSNPAIAFAKNIAKPQIAATQRVQRSLTTLAPMGYHEPSATSSPRPRTSSKRNQVLLEEATAVPQKLITCNAAALKNGERLEMRAMATHASVHDLQSLKKRQQIQESAGEAMLSGANSEDEACSASSDELVASIASSSATTSSGSLHMKNSNMSLEDELLLEKMNSLNGTPMEMSWSDEVFGNAGSSTA